MTILMSEVALDTLRINKCRLELDSVKLLLGATVATKQPSLRCLDLSQNYIFSENLQQPYGDSLRILAVEGKRFAKLRYLENEWDKHLYQLVAAPEVESTLFFKNQQPAQQQRISIGSPIITQPRRSNPILWFWSRKAHPVAFSPGNGCSTLMTLSQPGGMCTLSSISTILLIQERTRLHRHVFRAC